jgi:triosephosphate isomerase
MRKLFFANWKMYLSDAAEIALAASFARAAGAANADLAVAPGFTALERVAHALSRSDVALGAQDAFWQDEGAYTGEVSPKQLAALGVKFVIVGHSERRSMGETDDVIARKAALVAADGMTPILCVGETKTERDAGQQAEVVRAQIAAVIGGWQVASPLIVAYEPRWAIGTGVACHPDDVAVMHELIRAEVMAAGVAPRILYGGSVNGGNAASYLALQGVDGLLVGGASTKPAELEAMLGTLFH